LRRVSGKIQKRRLFIEANQAMLKRKRQVERETMRGSKRVERLQKVDERRLEKLEKGQWLEGRVRRLVGHGAWIDIGSQMDGFLHISAIRHDAFVHHPADELTPGQEVKVRVKHIDPANNVLALTCLDDVASSSAEGGAVTNAFCSRGYPEGGVALQTICDDQELWGEVTRVTHFGCFMEVGLSEGLEGFLHINEYPERQIGQWAPDVFRRGQRLRTYAKEVDLEYNRLKLTAFRPRSLPRVPWQ
jgi:ribosomal protein S1